MVINVLEEQRAKPCLSRTLADPSPCLGLLQSLDSALVYSRGVAPARDSMAAYRYIQRPTPPASHGIGALLHLQGHRFGDREFVRTVFCGEAQGPRLLPAFPHALLEDGAPAFELPVEQLLAPVRQPLWCPILCDRAPGANLQLPAQMLLL